MKAFVTTDLDTIREMLTGEALQNVVPDGLGNVLLVFESTCPDASDLLTVKPGGELTATVFFNHDDGAKPVDDTAQAADLRAQLAELARKGANHNA